MRVAVVNATRGNKLNLTATGGLYTFYTAPILLIHFFTIYPNV